MQDDNQQSQDDQQYHNPVDGQTYVTDGKWQTHNPASPVPEPTGSVKLEGVRLLADEQTIAASVSTETLSQYIKSISEAVESVAKEALTAFELLLQFELVADKPVSIQMSNQSEVSQELLQKIYEALNAIHAPAVSGNPVPFQAHYKINP